MKLVVLKLGEHWWIVGADEYPAMGPYVTKAEAEDDKRGITRFYKEEEKLNKGSYNKDIGE